MPESMKDIIEKFLEEMQINVAEERVLNYVVKEIHLGRKLSAVIQDPYVRNRVDEEHLNRILESKEVIEAVEAELNQAFEGRDFKFSE